MATVNVLSQVARRLEQMLAERMPDADMGSGAPLGSGSEALLAVRTAAAGALNGFDLSTAAETLDALAAVADLEQSDRYVLALVVLPNLDDRIARAVGLLHDDASRTRPSVGLAARVLEPLVGHEAAVEAAGLDAAVVHRGLADHVGAYGDPDVPVANREIVLHPRVLSLVLNGGPLNAPEPRLSGALQLEAVPRLPADEPEASPSVNSGNGSLVRQLAELPPSGRAVGLLCVGPDVETTLRLVRPFAQRQQLRILRVDLPSALALGETPETFGRHVRRESILLHALPVWTQLPGREVLAEREMARRLAHMFARAPSPLIIHAEYLWTPPSDLPLTLVHLPMPGPPFRGRIALWVARDGRTTAADEETARQLATSFILPPAAVFAARADAEAAFRLLGGDYREQLRRAAHRQAATRIVRFATKITPRASWADLVAQPSVLRQLREIEWRAAHRARVLEDTGFTGRRGFLALLVGPSGTGKTLTAEIIAGAQGFDLFKVDLAALVSKYIGDTEKNLAQIFEDAESAHAILFFDEADAVFGKRSEVRDAHDRYANQEVNYLLQRVEAYEGVIILATNLRQNMDDAFLRRLDLVVELPFPDEDARAKIWRRIWPPSVTLAPDIDLAEIAAQFRLAGGSIRNAAVDATFRAVAREGDAPPIRIEREDLLLAIGREHQKLGRPVTRAEFGADYSDVIDNLFASSAAGANVA
jgi:hypothetical protein